MSRLTTVLFYSLLSSVLVACGGEGGANNQSAVPNAASLSQVDAQVRATANIASEHCNADNALASANFDIPLYNSSSNWLPMQGISAGSYLAYVDSDTDLAGYTLNLASDWNPDSVYSRINLSGNNQQVEFATGANTNIAFITIPRGSAGANVTLYVCNAVAAQDPVEPDINDEPDNDEPDNDDQPDNNTSAPTAIATGLPKRDAAGSLVSAQSSGLSLSTAFVTSGNSYWYNHPGVADTLSDSCVRLHDSYWTRGPDGKVYATWHPPVVTENGEQCFFGHEHGDNPAASPFYSQGTYQDLKDQGFIPVPFGYANEVLAASGGNRHEDHFGHKLFRENFRMAYGNSVDAGEVTSTGSACDALLKLHQGTHSADGLSNHLHEAIAHVNCDALEGYAPSRAHVTALVPIGRPGWFSNNCSGAYPVPGQTDGTRGSLENNAPTGVNPASNVPVVLGFPLRMVNFSDATQNDIINRVDGERIIAGAGCLNTWQDQASSKVNNRRFGQAMNDTWVRPLTITNSVGEDARFYLKSYYSVHNPSRVFYVTDGGAVTIQSSVDACRNPPQGPNIPNRPSDLCQQVLNNPLITVRDEASPYNGTIRNLNFKTLDLDNNTGSTTLWTDAFGREISSTNAEFAIRQYISTGYNGASALGVAGTIATPSSNKVCRPDSGPYPSLSQSDECYWDGNDDLLFAKEWWRDFSSPSLRIHSPN